MSEMKTKRDGNFRLDGTTDEMTDIDPQLKIYHDCDDGIKVKKKHSLAKLTNL